jgi:hypothetical protein
MFSQQNALLEVFFCPPLCFALKNLPTRLYEIPLYQTITEPINPMIIISESGSTYVRHDRVICTCKSGSV